MYKYTPHYVLLYILSCADAAVTKYIALNEYACKEWDGQDCFCNYGLKGILLVPEHC